MLAEPIGRGGSVEGPLGATVVNVRIGWRGRPLCLPGQEEEKKMIGLGWISYPYCRGLIAILFVLLARSDEKGRGRAGFLPSSISFTLDLLCLFC